jgi:hypothetical protein
MLRPFLACALALVLLSGCMAANPSAPGPAPPSAADGAHAQSAGTGAPSSAPPGSSPTSAPAQGSAPAKASAKAANATAAAPETTKYGGGGLAMAAVPGVATTGAAIAEPPEVTLDGSESGLVVEMAWTSASPASDTMALDLVLGGKTVATVAGTGPLHLALPTPAAGKYALKGRPTGPNDLAGVSVLQDFTLWGTVFKGLPFDPAYVAPK